jgi:hypothetical protein
MIDEKLVDLVPFEDDFAIYLETWMNEEAWFRSMFWDRRVGDLEEDGHEIRALCPKASTALPSLRCLRPIAIEL